MRILISVFAASVTTAVAYVWQMRQSRAESPAPPARPRLKLALDLLFVGWGALMSVLVWVGFLDPVRSMGAYPFGRLGASLLVGAGVTAVGAVLGVLLRCLELGETKPRLPFWRVLNPMGIQMLFIMFSGLAFQHSWWGGPP